MDAMELISLFCYALCLVIYYICLTAASLVCFLGVLLSILLVELPGVGETRAHLVSFCPRLLNCSQLVQTLTLSSVPIPRTESRIFAASFCFCCCYYYNRYKYIFSCYIKLANH